MYSAGLYNGAVRDGNLQFSARSKFKILPDLLYAVQMQAWARRLLTLNCAIEVLNPLEIAGHLERMTALLLSINKANKVKESGLKITGI